MFHLVLFFDQFKDFNDCFAVFTFQMLMSVQTVLMVVTEVQTALTRKAHFFACVWRDLLEMDRFVKVTITVHSLCMCTPERPALKLS